MTSLVTIYKHRFLILLWSVGHVLLFSAVLHGWPSLHVILKKEEFYSNLCTVNQTAIALIETKQCAQQQEKLNLVFTTGVASGSIAVLFIGRFVDLFGPRKIRLFSCFLFVLSFLCFVFANEDRPDLVFPAIITLSAAGLTLLLTIFQVANMFENWKASVISLFNGAVDSSAIVLLFFKLVYDAGVALRSIIIFYYLFAIVAILVFTFILPSYTISSERLEALGLHKNVDAPLVKADEESNDTGNVKIEQTHTEKRSHEKNDIVQNDETDLQLSPLCLEDSQDINEVHNLDSNQSSAPKLKNAVFTSEYILLVLFLSVCNLRLWFYVGSLNSYLEFMSDNDIDTVSHYTNWFGIIQFAGFIFAPFVGFVMDWKPKSKRNQQTDIGFVVGFLLTSFVALLLNIFVLVPILSVQYVSFVIQVVLRAFVYAAYTAFLLHKFPLIHFGTLYGSGHLISSALGSVQYGLFIVAEETLEKDPFWVNVSLLVLCLSLNILPALLWFKERKQEKQGKTTRKQIVIR